MPGAPANGAVSDGDPFAGAMPKEEIGALRFLKVSMGTKKLIRLHGPGLPWLTLPC